jgi:hypothetical protein
VKVYTDTEIMADTSNGGFSCPAEYYSKDDAEAALKAKDLEIKMLREQRRSNAYDFFSESVKNGESFDRALKQLEQWHDSEITQALKDLRGEK